MYLLKFIVLAPTSKSMIHLELIFVYGGDWVQTLFICMWIIASYSSSICCKGYTSRLHCLGTLVEINCLYVYVLPKQAQNQLCINVKACFWTFNSVYTPYANTTLFWFLWLCSQLEIRKCKSSNLFLLFQNYFIYPWSLAISTWILGAAHQLLQ